MAKHIYKPERKTVMMPTLDDWCPNHVLVDHPSGLSAGVEVSFIELMSGKIAGKVYPKRWRVCVWGNDDLGMERDYEDRQEALVMYNLVTSWETVDKYALAAHGFVYA